VVDIEFEAFFSDRYDEVRRALTVAFGDARLAEECAQEAFVRAFARWTRVRKMESPAGWVYVVATNAAPAAVATRCRSGAGRRPG
jgi:DNA-directed RNA polymerase specialized sigma24 family protein